MNDVLKQLNERKSVRVYTDQAISVDDKQSILEAAVMAPTAGNQQLYTILDITDHALQARLAETCDHQPFIAEAKMVLIFCADCQKWFDAYVDTDSSPRKIGVGDLMIAIDDALIAAQNAVVAAESLGIGSCYIGDIMENCEIHRELFNLPAHVFPAAMLVFGYPTKNQQERIKPDRVDMKYIVHENQYREMPSDERKAMFESKAKQVGYQEWMQAFCNRKYNSDFAKEMTRSVEAYLKEFL